MNEREIFEKAIEIQNPAQRQAFLDQACAGDATLRAQLNQLLASHQDASQFLNVPLVDQLGPPGKDRVPPTIELSSSSGIAVGRQANSPRRDDEDDESQPTTDLSFLQPSTKSGSLGRLGHYEILKMLGQGAFGIVFKAFDEKLHRHVAVKTMSPQLASTSPPRKRFLREARSVAALKHENIVQIYSVEEQPLPYLAMEFVDGQTLQQKLDGSGPLEVPEILHLGRQMAAGLAAAHEKGLIHRDIKPGNILLEAGAEQKVKITDFGLARAADDATMTRTGTIAGTPMYMAPEQAMGQTLDHRADLFSLGSVLYQMTCGRPPFRGANAMAVLKRVIDESPRPIQDILPQVPDWLCAIIEKLHAKNPHDRYQTAKEVAELLARCQNELQINGKVTSVPIARKTPSAATQAGQAAARHSAGGSAVNPSSRGPLVAVAAAAVLLLVGLGITELAGITHLFRKSANEPLPAASNNASESGTQVNPTQAMAPPGRALEFDGKSLVTIPTLTYDGGPVTVELTVHPTTAAYSSFAMLGKSQVMFYGNEKARGVNVDLDGQTLVAVLRDPPPVVGKTIRVACVFDGTTLNYLEDGKVVATGVAVDLLPKREAGGYIGGNAIPSFQGWIDEVRISKTARYPGDYILQPRFDPDENTLALYHCDDGQGEVLTDSSGNGHHGKIVGAKWVRAETSPQLDAAVTVQRLPDGGYLAIAASYRVQIAPTGLIQGVAAGQATLIESTAFGRMGTSMPGKVEAKHSGTTLTFTEGDDYRLIYEFGPQGFVVKAKVSTAAAQRDGIDGKPYYLFHQTRFPKSAQRVRPLDGVAPFALPATNFEDSYTNSFVVDFADGSEIEVRCDQPSEHSGFSWTEGPYTWGRTNLKSDGDNEIRYELRPPGKAKGWQGWPADAPPPAIAPFDATQAKQHQEAWAKYLGVPVEWENSIGMKFRLIPPSEFTMGMTKERVADVAGLTTHESWKSMWLSSAPEHRVRLTQAYYLGTYEVTQEQYEKVMGVNPSYYSAGGEGKDKVAGEDTKRHPVETLSFIDAAEFCIKLSKQEKLKPVYFRVDDAVTLIVGESYRLPTEAEWENACRAGSTTAWHHGDQESGLGTVAWFDGNSGAMTHPVGQLKANSFGLYDLHGNVREWCQDFYDQQAYAQRGAGPTVDPRGPDAGSARVMRGGQAGSPGRGCYLALRSATVHSVGDASCGFRLCAGVAVSRPSR